MRKSTIKRKTKETDIEIELNIDGTGNYKIETPIGFLTHMLDSFVKHGLFDLSLKVKGDLEVDQHHTVEDIGIALGQAFCEALGDKKGINRSGYCIYPMDDALATIALDIGGRAYFTYEGSFSRRYCGDLDLDLIEDFFIGFTSNLNANIFLKIDRGRNDHHKLEAVFKAFAKSMSQACAINERIKDNIPSTKGII